MKHNEHEGGFEMAKKILQRKGTARKKGTRKFKLEIELVPRTVFYSNVRELVPKDVWDKIRTEQYKKAGHRCEICGARGGLDCHERWEYDDEKHVQRLVGFAALCKNCHMIKHAGFSMHTPRGRAMYDRDELIGHFCAVNVCSKRDFFRHEDDAFAKWRERSEHVWKQDLGKYSKHAGKMVAGTYDDVTRNIC